jgi:hypothetical protein
MKIELKGKTLKDFCFAGMSEMVVEEEDTHFNLRVKRKGSSTYFIYAFGNYVGHYNYISNLFFEKEHEVSDVSFTIGRLLQAIRELSELPFGYKVYHTGQCGVCGRALTDPVSIELGIGPYCIKRIKASL